MNAAELDGQLQKELPNAVQVLKVIPIVQCVGALLVCGIAVIIGLGHEGAPEGDGSTEKVFTALTALVTAGCWAASFVLPAQTCSLPKLRQALAKSLNDALTLQRSGRILAMALREGAAILGGVALIVAGTSGNLRGSPWLLVNALPALAFTVYTLATLTSADELRAELLASLAME